MNRSIFISCSFVVVALACANGTQPQLVQDLTNGGYTCVGAKTSTAWTTISTDRAPNNRDGDLYSHAINGRLLIMNRSDLTGGLLDVCTNSWESIDPRNQPPPLIAGHPYLIGDNGKQLLALARPTQASEPLTGGVYDFAKRAWSSIHPTSVPPIYAVIAGPHHDNFVIVEDGAFRLYDPQGDSWSQPFAYPLSPRGGPTIGVSDNKLVVWGGGPPAVVGQPLAPLLDGAVFDFASQKWTMLTAPGENPPELYANDGLSNWDDDGKALFVWRMEPPSPTAPAVVRTTVKIYLPESDSWTVKTFDPGILSLTSGLPRVLYNGSVFLVYNSIQLGEATGLNLQPGTDGFVFDAKAQTWQEIMPPSKDPHVQLIGSVPSDAASGSSVKFLDPRSNNAFSFTPATTAWASVSIQDLPLSQPRGQYVTAWVAGAFVFWGGVDARPRPEIACVVGVPCGSPPEPFSNGFMIRPF